MMKISWQYFGRNFLWKTKGISIEHKKLSIINCLSSVSYDNNIRSKIEQIQPKDINWVHVVNVVVKIR